MRWGLVQLSVFGGSLAVLAACSRSIQPLAGTGSGGMGGMDGGLTCALDENYSFTLPDGKLGFFYRPGDGVSLVRFNSGSDQGISCGVQLPTCGSPSGIDTSDLFADLTDADVQQALTTLPPSVFGDRSLTSRPVFQFGSDTGGFSVVVGFECATSTSTCDATPAGVRRLVTDVNTVVTAALADPACANVR